MINIGLLNFDIGNLKSLLQIFKNLPLSYNIFLVNNSYDLCKIDRLILPGHGSIVSCLNFLKKNFSFYSLNNFFNNNPTLGICIGEHIFFTKSDENIFNLNSLNVFSGFIKKFDYKFNFKIPHIGWNKVIFIKNHLLFNNIPNLSYFYFSHSFYALPLNFDSIYGLVNYFFNFTSIYINNNIFLCQFHPEKSSQLGMRLLFNFSIWNI